MDSLTLGMVMLFRRRVRVAMAMGALIMAFTLLVVLESVRSAFSEIGSGEVTRLVVTSRRSAIGGLPVSTSSNFRRLKIGESAYAWANWVGGSYQKANSKIANIAISKNYLSLYPELRVNASALARFHTTKDGAIVGRALAERYHWKIGQRIRLFDVPYQSKSSNYSWQYTIVGTFTVKKQSMRPLEEFFFSRWDYFNDSALFADSHVGWFIVEPTDQSKAESIEALIDLTTKNSDDPTRTETENDFQKRMIDRASDSGVFATDIVVVAVFFIIVLTGKVIVQGVKECWRDIGIMKTVGFSGWAVFRILVCTSLIFTVTSCLIGTSAAFLITRLFDLTSLLGFYVKPVSPLACLEAVALAVGIGLAIVLAPALKAATSPPAYLLGR